MKLSIGSKLWTGFISILFIFMVVCGISYMNTVKMTETTERVTHTYKVLTKLRELLITLQDTETGQRGYIITGEERYLEFYQVAVPNTDKQLLELKQLTEDNPSQQRRLETLGPLIAGKLDELKETIDLRRSKGLEAAQAIVASNKGKNLMDQIRAVMREIENQENELLEHRKEEARISSKNTVRSIIFSSLFASALTFGAGLFLTRHISRPLKELAGIAERITAGDLSMTLAVSHRVDEVGLLAQAFSSMVESLRKLTMDIRDGINVLASSSAEILATTTQVAASSAETSTAVSETTTTVEEVKQTVQLANQKAKQVSDSAQQVAKISQKGQLAVEELVAGIGHIREQTASAAESIVRLGEQSQVIGEIILTVNDLAEQSNLLAVNAAIEAAKAGDQGKGFAVVAQEIKCLAEQSKQATAQARAILSDIQKATGAAVMATDLNGKAVDAGVQQSFAAGEAIRMLAESIIEAAQAALQIAASSQQQLVGMDQVALAMESIKQTSAQNMAGTSQAETAAQNLHKLGLKLKQLVERYQL